MGMNFLVHAGPKVGKTWLAETGPAPRLFLESGGETKFTRTTKTYWDPLLDAPPQHDGKWETAVVSASSNERLDAAYQWLLKGGHDFKSVITDNLTLIQKNTLRDQFGSKMTQQQWGEHLPEIEQRVWNFRNLVDHPTTPIDLVMFCVGSKPENGKYTPFLQGQIRDNISYIIDVVGYLYTQVQGDQYVRQLLIQDHPSAVAGSRIHELVERFGSVITNPDMTELVTIGGSS